MELKLNRISASPIETGAYTVELACSFDSPSAGGLSPHYGIMSVKLDKDQISDLTLIEIEEMAKTAVRRLLA